MFSRHKGLWAAEQRKIKKKIRVNYGSEFHSEFLCGKSSQNSPKPVLIPCVFCLCIHNIAKSVLTMSMMGFQNKSLDEGWGGWDKVYPVFLNFFLLQSP